MHPRIVRHLLLPLHEWVLRRGTFAYLRDLEASQWWPRERLRHLQETKLRQLLAHAYARCPFYRRRIDAAGLEPAGIRLNQLPQLPTLSKSEIIEHAAEMTDLTVSGGLRPYTTGGSTGAPLAFHIDRSRQAADQAARARSRRWFGIDLGERELYLWGSPVEQAAQDRIKSWRDTLTNHRLINAFRMTPAAMTAYLDELHRFDPVHLFGYPSSLARLVRYAAECRRAIPNRSLRAVFVTGEFFQPADRATLESQVGRPVADGYGSREGGFVAHQCPSGTYHVTMESLIVELLDARGDEVAEGQVGEITLTHLDAYGMPFIRYRTGDLARRGGGDPCACGRGLEALRSIEGRRTDMLRTADGGFAHALSVIYVLREEPTVKEFKITQKANLDLEVQVVPRAAFDADRQRRVAGLLRRQIGPATEVRFAIADEISPDPSGKHRYVVCEAS